MKYLIIEDEKAAARNLKAMLEQLAPDMELIDVLDSVADTIDWFGCHAMPELVGFQSEQHRLPAETHRQGGNAGRPYQTGTAASRPPCRA